MSPDMAGFGLIFQNDANQSGIICYMRIDSKSENRPVRGPGVQKSTSERDWDLVRLFCRRILGIWSQVSWYENSLLI